MELVQLGWAEPFKSAFETQSESGWVPARVISSQREHVRLETERGPLPAAPSGKLRHEAAEGDLPIVGDWVAVGLDPGGTRGVIHRILPRRSLLARKRPGRSVQQLMAANVDFVFVVTALNQDFSPRRIERALALIWEGGAQPVVVLTKLDACDDPESYLERAEAVAIGVPVHAVSVPAQLGLSPLHAYLTVGRTVALIGSSGVGKSTLLNWCLGEERAETSVARAEDDKGRHTTTARELYVLPTGGALIDSPGTRELGLLDADEGFETAFDDVAALAANCRFADCQHQAEPGCAVRDALQRGELEAARYAAYGKLQRELAHEQRRHDERANLDHKRELRRTMRIRTRAQRSHPKH